ncbi:hypothetical protein AgCh_030595 [Apium graveolens]
MTLQEKILNLVHEAGGVGRLGIPEYNWWSEALHGVSNVNIGTNFSSPIFAATSFPQVICTAASFNTSLFYTIGKVTKQDMDDTYQPPFKSCVVDANVSSVMCSYNQVNGKPSCADPDLLTGVIRNEWNLNGYISSDCDSLKVMFESQHYTRTPEETAAIALKAGVDLNCGHYLSNYTLAAVQEGLAAEADVNRAVKNNFVMLMRLGFFDGDPRQRLYGNVGPNDVCTPMNQDLAREAARQGFVLLKNSHGSLPLSPAGTKSVAVIGPNANVTTTMIGNYAGIPCRYTTPLQGITAVVPTTYFSPGCANVECVTAQVDDAKRISATADATILVVGADQSIEKETLDRIDISLPGQQTFLVQEVTKASKGPVILVIMSGGGMDVQFAKDDPKVTSILWIGYPGEAGGAALADILFGFFNPSGKLPMSWYPQSYVNDVNMTNMNMRPDPATGYPGRMSGSHTVLLFWTPPNVHNSPQKQLMGFEKVFLTPKEKENVSRESTGNRLLLALGMSADEAQPQRPKARPRLRDFTDEASP